MTELPRPELAKTFDPAEIEARWYAHWEEGGAFRPARPQAEPYTIVMPPPNVTGSLHIGHALDNTLQDILIRHARLQGKDALWVVGTDHAGIATQMVVERNLAADGIRRQDLGREAFIEKVWDWKAESGGQITRQLRRLGASCDWSNERFTMDEGFSKAVVKVFVELHRRGLIYRDKRLVNWDPKFQTAISDLEVEQKEVQGHFWHFRYPLEDGSGFIAIATTRPETILGDGAVAVNPADERYKHLVGKLCRLPIVDRLIPIIADEHVKMDFGSGAVKITAAHDWNDYDVARRHPEANILLINLMNADATMSDATPPAYRGLDRYEARKKVVADFEALGLLDKVEPHTHMVPHGDRSGVPIEPWLTDQWYVDAATLAGPALEAVRNGAIRVVPETWKKTWYNWLENIQPWCVSRQLWWGHQIPAWFGPDGTCYVAETEAEAQAQAGAGVTLTRDSDVLDTWFSSALWPFATLGWPDALEKSPFALSEVEGRAAGEAPGARASTSLSTNGGGEGALGQPRPGSDLARHYPNDVLVSGFDILFFWDARMAMQGIEFMGEVPWKTLYLHGLVRDAQGQKMSKSKGNTVDPLLLIDRYGADALRFTMAAMESQGRDIKLDEKRVEGYRNFATKLWNATRFAMANGIGASATLEPPKADLAVNRWIIAETVRTVQALDLALADFRFDEAANTIYHFTWDRYCDWYLELIKTQIDDETKAVAGWVLDQILVMLHPFMPFITEELWHALGTRGDLILARWPMADARALDPAAAEEIDWLIRLISQIRAARSETNVPPSARTDLYILTTPKAGIISGFSIEVSSVLIRLFEKNAGALRRLARIDTVVVVNTGIEIDLTTGQRMDRTRADQSSRKMGPQLVVDDVTYILPLEGVIDIAAEKARLAKAAEGAEKERDTLDKRLASPGFVEKAKPEAVEKARADRAERAAEAERLRAALARLG